MNEFKSPNQSGSDFMNQQITVSVIVPLYNEEKFIENCILSLTRQDYPRDKMEWIFVDGLSEDSTYDIIKQYELKFPNLIKILENPKKIVPCAMNIGIRASSGKYIIRLDAHAEYSEDYISKCIYYLENKDIENVGGVLQTKAEGFTGKAISRMLSSTFGVGNSYFRTGAKSGYVDTVPFGAFRRDVFKKYGGYDERLVRNQDIEMNFRIIKNGGKVFLADDIHMSYYCRDSVKSICDMARKNGMWNIITMKLCPGAMSTRHFVPAAFVFSILILSIAAFFIHEFAFLLAAELSLYFIFDFIFSMKSGSSCSERAFLLLLFPLFHISYGLGSFLGLFKLGKKKYKKDGYVPESI